MFTDLASCHTTDPVDVELPLHGPQPVDVDLAGFDAVTRVQATPSPADSLFHPTMSQIAGQALQTRVRWPGRSRAGYHGGTGWNWMRDGSAGFGERTTGRS